jgi:hypothetical protein
MDVVGSRVPVRPEEQPAMTHRARAVIAILLAAAPLLGCSDDGGEENFETPNEVDGAETEGTPAGGVDSTEDGS